MKLTWYAVYAVLFAYRSIFSVLAVGIIARLTTLGDSHSYLFSTLEAAEEKAGFGLNSTFVTHLVGIALRHLLFANEYLVSIAFQAIAFVGIVLLLLSLPSIARRRILILFFFPSFAVWSSIAGKETFVVLFLCLLLRGFVDFVLRGKLRLVSIGFAMIGLALFKPHLLAPMLLLIGGGFCASYVRQREILLLIFIGLSLVILFILRPYLEAVAPDFFIGHFTGDNARSSRPPFWTEYGDYFGKAAEGMLLAFVGPTLSETRLSVVHLFSFVESLVLLSILGFMLLREFPRIPVFCFLLGIGVLFWTLAPNYGPGVMNPGTAIRYRAGWLPIIYFCVAVLLTGDFGRMWIQTFRRRRAGDPPPAVSSTQPA